MKIRELCDRFRSAITFAMTSSNAYCIFAGNHTKAGLHFFLGHDCDSPQLHFQCFRLSIRVWTHHRLEECGPPLRKNGRFQESRQRVSRKETKGGSGPKPNSDQRSTHVGSTLAKRDSGIRAFLCICQQIQGKLDANSEIKLYYISKKLIKILMSNLCSNSFCIMTDIKIYFPVTDSRALSVTTDADNQLTQSLLRNMEVAANRSGCVYKLYKLICYFQFT